MHHSGEDKMQIEKAKDLMTRDKKMNHIRISINKKVPIHSISVQPCPTVSLKSRAKRAQLEMILRRAVIRKARYQAPMSLTASTLGFLLSLHSLYLSATSSVRLLTKAKQAARG